MPGSAAGRRAGGSGERLLRRAGGPLPAGIPAAMDPFDALARPLAPADRALFAARVREDADVLGDYGLDGSPVRVLLRHGPHSDVGVFHEIFHAGIYTPPAEPEARLDALGRPPRVVDAGGNVGLFGAWLLARRPGAEITSYEPEPGNLAVLEACAAACKACGDECAGHAEMHEHCRVCAESCRRCETACRELVDSLG